MSKLALKGGQKAVSQELKPYITIDAEEIESVVRIMESGRLSRFAGTKGERFLGGAVVQEFERSLCSRFKTPYAVTTNSATSSLITAVGAAGVEPGDEVIVSPWTMSASATSILVWNAIPIFADIEKETFNLNPICVEKKITSRTKAIMVPNIFGHPAQLNELREISDAHDLVMIEDNSQSPAAKYYGREAGTVGDIGVLSFNCHKHINTGEGGAAITANKTLAEKMQLIRNHAEAVVMANEPQVLPNMVGFNFRLGEIEAAIGIEQMKKLDRLIASRISVADYLTDHLAGLAGLRTPIIRDKCSHSFYIYPLVYDDGVTGVPRGKIVDALRAEGVPVASEYVNVHLLPMYQEKTAYGSFGYPWIGGSWKGSVDYSKGTCPVAEMLNETQYMGIGLCEYEFTKADLESVVEAFNKVWQHMSSL